MYVRGSGGISLHIQTTDLAVKNRAVVHDNHGCVVLGSGNVKVDTIDLLGVGLARGKIVLTNNLGSVKAPSVGLVKSLGGGIEGRLAEAQTIFEYLAVELAEPCKVAALEALDARRAVDSAALVARDAKHAAIPTGLAAFALAAFALAALAIELAAGTAVGAWWAACARAAVGARGALGAAIAESALGISTAANVRVETLAHGKHASVIMAITLRRVVIVSDGLDLASVSLEAHGVDDVVVDGQHVVLVHIVKLGLVLKVVLGSLGNGRGFGQVEHCLGKGFQNGLTNFKLFPGSDGHLTFGRAKVQTNHTALLVLDDGNLNVAKKFDVACRAGQAGNLGEVNRAQDDFLLVVHVLEHLRKHVVLSGINAVHGCHVLEGLDTLNTSSLILLNGVLLLRLFFLLLLIILAFLSLFAFLDHLLGFLDVFGTSQGLEQALNVRNFARGNIFGIRCSVRRVV